MKLGLEGKKRAGNPIGGGIGSASTLLRDCGQVTSSVRASESSSGNQGLKTSSTQVPASCRCLPRSAPLAWGMVAPPRDRVPPLPQSLSSQPCGRRLDSSATHGGCAHLPSHPRERACDFSGEEKGPSDLELETRRGDLYSVPGLNSFLFSNLCVSHRPWWMILF